MDRRLIGIAAGALLLGLLVSGVKLSLEMRPRVSIPLQQTGPEDALLQMLNRPKAPQLLAGVMAAPVQFSRPEEEDRILELLGNEDSYYQLWALAVACQMNYYKHPYKPIKVGQNIANRALEDADPRRQAAGALVLGCLPDPAAAERALTPLLTGSSEAAAVAAAMELARLDAREQAGAVAALAERIQDPGLAALVSHAAASLRRELDAVSAQRPKGL